MVWFFVAGFFWLLQRELKRPEYSLLSIATIVLAMGALIILFIALATLGD